MNKSSKTVIAHFDSIDMATIAAKNVTSRISGIDGVKVAYKTIEHSSENDVFSDFFLPFDSTNGVNPNAGLSFPVNFSAVRMREDEQRDINTCGVRVEIKTSNENVQNIKSNLRCYGGLSVKVI